MSLGVIAIVVSLVSAAFTGWQALETARRNKRETEAFFRLEYVADLGDEDRPSNRNWVLWNSGAADALEVRVRLSFDPREFEYGRLIFGTIAAGKRRVLEADKLLPAPNLLMTIDDRRRVTVEVATVTWRTPRNEMRTQLIEMSGLR